MSTTKEQIAEVFERHVARAGYAKTNLDDVARELRISKKTIYVHFDGKREIYQYIVAGMAKREQLRMKAALAHLGSSREKVETLTRMTISMGRMHVEETTREDWLQEAEIAADAFKKAHGDLLREIVADGMNAGELPDGDPSLVERLVAAMVVEYLTMVNDQPGYDRDDELVERIMRFIG